MKIYPSPKSRRDEKFFGGLVILTLCFVFGFWTDFGTIGGRSGIGVNGIKKDTRKLLHVAAIFPINGSGGWQGGQVIRK